MLLQQLVLMLIPVGMTWQSIATVLLGIATLTLICKAFYNIYLHPLRKYPGPWWLAASRLPYTVFIFQGTATKITRDLHDKYGHVVRITPDTLSYTCSQIWSDVYGGNKAGCREGIPKDPHYYIRQVQVPDISTASNADHRRLRHIQSYAFSEKAVMQQEKYLRQYIATFIASLSQEAEQTLNGHGEGVVNFTRWFNFLTTDIIGELTFGESFGGLENGELHPWLDSVFWTIKASAFIREMNHWSVYTTKALRLCVPREILERQQAVISFGEEAAARRVKLGTERPDFMSYILRQADDKRMTRKEIELAAITFIIAGSETVATMLSGTVYLLCINPEVLRNLTERIRADFVQESDLSLVKLQQHEYLNVVLLECLRLYPPAPDNLFRRTTASGAIIMGEFVPPRTCVTMNLWAANRSTFNFHRPNDMVPERWMKPCPPEFQDDDRDAMKPFSVGHRNCLGKNLAWAEMRMILAYLLWYFDLKLNPVSKDWIDRQKVFMLWEKPDLIVKISPRSPRNHTA